MDLAAAGALALTRESPVAIPLVFAAGVVSSIGPCVAPRFIAVAACAAAAPRNSSVIAAFIGGLMAAYGVLGLVSSLLSQLVAISSFVYLAVAVSLGIGGIMMVVRAHGDHCDPQRKVEPRSLIQVAVLGASFAFVVSPCCTPFVVLILSYSSLLGKPLYGAALLCVFALGHSLPLLAYGSVGGRVSALLERFSLGQASSIASGSLMLALAAFYAVLV